MRFVVVLIVSHKLTALHALPVEKQHHIILWDPTEVWSSLLDIYWGPASIGQITYNSLLPDDRHAVFDAVHSVGNLTEIILP